MVLQRGQAPPPARPWEDAPEVEYRLYKNRINMARSYDSAQVTIKRLILREAASESDGPHFIIEEDSADTADKKPPIHKIPQLPISKDKYFVVSMYPPEDLDDDDTPMDGDKPVKFLFSFYNLYLTGYTYDDDVWHMFDDAMIEGISQEARDKFVKLLGFPGNYGTIGQDYRKLVIGFHGQCDTHNKIVGVSSGKTSADQLMAVLCRTTIGLPESTRFPFLAQFHLRSFHSGSFDAVLDSLVIAGEEHRKFSLHLTKWGIYSTIGKKGRKSFDASVIPTSGINSFSALLNFVAVATNKKYDEEQNLLKHEVAKKHIIGDGDIDKKGGNLGQDKNNKDSQDKKKTDQDNDKTWFCEAPLMRYVPQGRQNINLAGEPDVDTCAMLEIDRKTCLKELNWTLLLQLAMRKSCKYVKEKLSVKVDKLGKDSLINCAKSRMSSALIHTDKAFIANMYFVEAGAIAVRCSRKEDSRHVAKATGATRVTTVSDMEGKETFDTSFLGHSGKVVEERISDDEINLVKGTKNISLVSVILRGANDLMLNEIESVLRDAVFIVKRTLGSNMIFAVGGGAGAVEAALSVCSENQATADLGSRAQLAIGELTESLSVRPKVPGELTLEGPCESPDMGKDRLIECTSHPLCGPGILTAGLDAKRARSWYGITKNTSQIFAVGGGAAAVEAALSVLCSENQTTADLGSGEQLAIGEVPESLSVRPKVPVELALEGGPWESPGMGKARMVECTSHHPLCGPSILTAHEDWEHHDHYPLGRLGIAA